MLYNVLIADANLSPWANALKENFRLTHAGSGEAVLKCLERHLYHAVVIDVDCPGTSQPAFLQWLLEHPKCGKVFVTSTPQGTSRAIQMIRAGVHDYIPKPLQAQDAIQTLNASLAGLVEQPKELTQWRRKHAPLLIGDDPKTLQTLATIKRIAASDCDVLITGPSGTGKELVAQCIHKASARNSMPFVAMNCAAIPRDLIESEIFGHTKGAFTGAMDRRAGKFELAHHGSLFLDEIGEMDISLQGKLLRVVQEREITPVGDSRVVHIDVRIISATNQDLLSMCHDKTFREDLYYRLNVVPIELAPLTERPLDIPALLEHFIERANRRHSRCIRSPRQSALDALLAYHWPGNVRELQNVIERIIVLKVTDTAIQTEDLPSCVLARSLRPTSADLPLPDAGFNLNEALASVETRLTVDALQRSGGNKARAAAMLGLKRTTLVERLKKLNIEAYNA